MVSAQASEETVCFRPSAGTFKMKERPSDAEAGRLKMSTTPGVLLGADELEKAMPCIGEAKRRIGKSRFMTLDAVEGILNVWKMWL